MATQFDQWRKDPFFPAAEEVQESADRMESKYRAWIYDRKQEEEKRGSSIELRKELQTSLGTAKWQLEEFEKAVGLSKSNFSEKDMMSRHQQFVVAIRAQISKIEASIKESVLEEGKSSLPWVKLDQGERDELALFITGDVGGGNRRGNMLKGESGSSETTSNMAKAPLYPRSHGDDRRCEVVLDLALRDSAEASKKDERKNNKCTADQLTNGHRRTASASADFGAWKVAIVEEANAQSRGLLSNPPKIVSIPVPKIPEATSKSKWSKNGYKKLKGSECQQSDNGPSSCSHSLASGIHACYERSENCLDSCGIDTDLTNEKQLYGWAGAFQRQLQRSQYQLQYHRPCQVAFSFVLAVFLLVIFLVRAI